MPPKLDVARALDRRANHFLPSTVRARAWRRHFAELGRGLTLGAVTL